MTSAFAPEVLEMAATAEAPIGRSVTAFLLDHAAKKLKPSDTVVIVATHEPAAEPWLPVLLKLRRTEDEGDPATAAEDFNHLVGGPFRPPKGWAFWSLEKKANYLDEHRPLAPR